MLSANAGTRGFAVSIAAVGVVLLVAATMGGCAVPAGPVVQTAGQHPTEASPPVLPPAETTATRDANALGGALQLSMLAPMSFSAEPKAKIASDGPVRVFAHISAVSTASSTITFDAAQLYLGESARVAAQSDHRQVDDSLYYERNAYSVDQTASVVASAGIVLQFPVDDVDAAYGPDDYAQLTATSFDDFARRFSAGEEANRLRNAGYWIVLDGQGVRSIAEQYRP